MNESNNTINKSDVKNIASYVLLEALKLLALTTRTSEKLLVDVMISAALRNTSIEQVCKEHEDFPSGKIIRTHLSAEQELHWNRERD